VRVSTASNRLSGIAGATVAGMSLTPDGIVVGLRRRRRKLRCSVAGGAPDPQRDAAAGDRHPDHDLRRVRAVILAPPVAAGRRLGHRRWEVRMRRLIDHHDRATGETGG